MKIVPKSEAELVSQFMNIPPKEIEMGPINNGRYVEAYAEVGASLEGNNRDAGSVLQRLEEASPGFIRIDTPFSYLSALRNTRAIKERQFNKGLESAVKNAGDTEATVVQERMAELERNTIHLSRGHDTEETVIKRLFPSGNYFLHATENEAVLSILNNGGIKATVGFEQDDRMDRTHGGSFGVSGNYNNVANILGTANHLAGFVADPQTVMQNQGGYFAPSSKSCWDELQYFPEHDDPLHVMRIRDAETHIETAGVAYQQASMFNAVLEGNPEVIASMPIDGVFQMQLGFSESMMLQETNPALLSRAFRISPRGDFRFTEMLGHDDENVSPLSVVVGAALEGAFGLETAQLLQQHGAKKMDARLLTILEPVFEQLGKQTEELYLAVADEVGSQGEIKVENTLFYCPEKDYKKWLEVLAHLEHQPAGVLTYDGRDVRTPAAFALALPDNGGPSISNQLSIIKSDRTIDWNDIFDEAPKAVPGNHFLIKPREANLAGVLTLDQDEKTLVIKSLDDLDTDNDD